jgi:hypothetical protein
MHHSDVAASLKTDADPRTFETERQMTEEERFGLISSLMVVVFGGSLTACAGRRAADRRMGARRCRDSGSPRSGARGPPAGHRPLLKNEHSILPLPTDVHGIAVIGGHADRGVLAGGGSSLVSPPGGYGEWSRDRFRRRAITWPPRPARSLRAERDHATPATRTTAFAVSPPRLARSQRRRRRRPDRVLRRRCRTSAIAQKERRRAALPAPLVSRDRSRRCVSTPSRVPSDGRRRTQSVNSVVFSVTDADD